MIMRGVLRSEEEWVDYEIRYLYNSNIKNYAVVYKRTKIPYLYSYPIVQFVSTFCVLLGAYLSLTMIFCIERIFFVILQMVQQNF